MVHRVVRQVIFHTSLKVGVAKPAYLAPRSSRFCAPLSVDFLNHLLTQTLREIPYGHENSIPTLKIKIYA